jgi:serine/threonine-protein kinase
LYLLPRADIYALGCVAYELITGRLPFVADSPVELLRMHESVDPRPPSELRPGVPVQLDRVILKALAKDPELRIPTANDFRTAVHRAVRLSKLSRSRILIADDNADHRELLSELFARSFPGATVEAVSDGLAAFDAIERQIPTVAVIDLDMPRMNGMELTAALRGREDTRSLPVIVLTGVGRGVDWEMLRSLGVTRFVVKPAIPQQLLSIVREIIEPEPAGPRR